MTKTDNNKLLLTIHSYEDEDPPWKELSKENKEIANNYEKARKTYVEGIKAGILPQESYHYSTGPAFFFSERSFTKKSWSEADIVSAATLRGFPKEDIDVLIETLKVLHSPTTTAYYINHK